MMKKNLKWLRENWKKIPVFLIVAYFLFGLVYLLLTNNYRQSCPYDMCEPEGCYGDIFGC